MKMSTFQSEKPFIRINTNASVLFIEPFYGGSHKVLIDILTKHVKSSLITLPAKKWHWRARCGALCIEKFIPEITTERVLFCSSVLNVTELIGLRPELSRLKKIIYFHENQLAYPVREIKERDIQYAYNQILSCLTADVIIFNSVYNKNSFLDNIKSVIKMLPDYRPKDVREKIQPKCKVFYFPLEFPDVLPTPKACDIVHIVWPHRWEFDKGPDEFCDIIRKLKQSGAKFKLSILGETFTDVPDAFEIIKNELKDELIHFGYLPSKQEYYDVLSSCHIVISTAKHEFFGVSVLEATYCGCFPLVPDALVYPEIYPPQCLYKSLENLFERLVKFCLSPGLASDERSKMNLDFSQFSSEFLIPKYREILDAS